MNLVHQDCQITISSINKNLNRVIKLISNVCLKNKKNKIYDTWNTISNIITDDVTMLLYVLFIYTCDSIQMQSISIYCVPLRCLGRVITVRKINYSLWLEKKIKSFLNSDHIFCWNETHVRVLRCIRLILIKKAATVGTWNHYLLTSQAEILVGAYNFSTCLTQVSCEHQIKYTFMNSTTGWYFQRD